MNCEVFERHFTLDKNDFGPDHSSSSDPNEFCNYVESIKSGRLAMGLIKNKPSNQEKENIFSMRRCLRYSRDLPKGHFITSDDITNPQPLNLC